MSPNNIRKVKPSTIRARSRNKKLAIIGVVAAIIIIIGAYVAVTQLGGSPSDVNPSPTATPTPTAATPTPTPAPSSSASPSASPSSEDALFNGTKVLLETSMGNITLQMRIDKPITTANFLNLTEMGLYDNTTFHRVIAGFMIQGGVIPRNDIATIPDEIGTNNHNYNMTIAMAKSVSPDSASSSFFINVADNNDAEFDSTYTVFGRVIDGMDVVMAISHAPVTTSPYMSNENSYPVQTITLIRATVLP